MRTVIQGIALLIPAASALARPVGQSFGWVEEARITSSDTVIQSQLGHAVSLSGETVLLGAPGLIGYVFARTGSSWVQEAKLIGSEASYSDAVGYSVSLDGTRAVLGAPFDDFPAQSGSAYVFADLDHPGDGFCFGDPGLGTPCPCSNDNDGSVPGSGCANGAFPAGAQLRGSGIPSVSVDTLLLIATSTEPFKAGLFFHGQGALTPAIPWGDGLRCADQGIVRLEVSFADAAGTSSTTQSMAALGGLVAGDKRYYQYWYRNPTSPACGSGVNDFNTTNGYVIDWLP